MAKRALERGEDVGPQAVADAGANADGALVRRPAAC